MSCWSSTDDDEFGMRLVTLFTPSRKNHSELYIHSYEYPNPEKSSVHNVLRVKGRERKKVWFNCPKVMQDECDSFLTAGFYYML